MIGCLFEEEPPPLCTRTSPFEPPPMAFLSHLNGQHTSPTPKLLLEGWAPPALPFPHCVRPSGRQGGERWAAAGRQGASRHVCLCHGHLIRGPAFRI